MMTWILLFLIFLVAALCQAGVWRRWICGSKQFRIPYVIFKSVLWLGLLSCIALNAIFDLGNAFMKLNGILLLVFGTTAMIEAIFLIFGFVQRITGCNRRFTTLLSIVFSAAAVVFTIYGTTVGRSRLRTEYIEVVSDRLPASFDGFRIVLFSDMHTGMMFGRDKMLSKMVSEINDLNPDLAVNCGDIVNFEYTELDETVLSILAGIKSRNGVVAVIGNHDIAIKRSPKIGHTPGEHADKVANLQRTIGWRVLCDTTIFLKRGTDSIAITGLTYPKELYRHSHRKLHGLQNLSEAYGDLSPAVYNLTLTHAPQSWESVKAAGYGDLTLSGHVHSMQTKLKIGNRSWSPASLLYREWSGRYEDSGRTLYINDGIGSIFVPMRIGARPEITIIELRKQ